MSDKILLCGAEFYAQHGVGAAERQVGGRYVVDVELEADLRPAAATDDLAQTISYAEVYAIVRQVIQSEHYKLVETLAQRLADELLQRFPAESVRVRVLKRPPPVDGIIESAGVEICRSRTQ